VVVGVFATVVTALLVREHFRQQRRRNAWQHASLDQVQDLVRVLMLRYGRAANFVAVTNGRDGFLQMALTGRYRTYRKVELGLPDTDWTRNVFDHAVEVLREGTSSCKVEHNPGNTAVPRFLRVSIEGNEDAVLPHARELLARTAAVLGFETDQTYAVKMSGPDHPEFLRSVADRLEQGRRLRALSRRFAEVIRRQAEELERTGEYK
jgi:hypothetical protein